MKITGYRTLQTIHHWGRPVGDVNGHIESGITEVPLVIVDTDEGVSGVGMGSHQDLARIFPAIEGEDPRAVTALYDRMLARVFKASHAGATFGGIGTFDMALWDIKAKLAGEPLWRLLGGRDRFVAGYASGLDIALDDAELALFYSDMAGRGFTSGKLKGGRDLSTDLRRLAIIADELRVNTPEPSLMLDVNESWNLKQAVRYVSKVEEVLDLAWIEEPIRRWDAEGHARLSASVKAAVATGENLTGRTVPPTFQSRRHRHRPGRGDVGSDPLPARRHRGPQQGPAREPRGLDRQCRRRACRGRRAQSPDRRGAGRGFAVWRRHRPGVCRRRHRAWRPARGRSGYRRGGDHGAEAQRAGVARRVGSTREAHSCGLAAVEHRRVRRA